jgi:hypothetical protein
MFARILYAILVAVIAAVITYIVGALLLALPGNFVQSLGAFFEDHCGLIGFIVGVLWFFFGTRPLVRRV